MIKVKVKLAKCDTLIVVKETLTIALRMPVHPKYF